MLKIKNLADNKAEIYIYGNIIDDTEAWIIGVDQFGAIGFEWPDDIRKQIDELAGKPIDVHIASDGGDVAAGISIFNMLQKHNAPVTVYIDSWAASIASVIAFAGQKIVMPENTFIMIHPPKGGAYGESDYLRSVADWLDKIENMIAETYAKHTDKTVDEIKEYMAKETWFTAKEASEIFDIVELVESNDIKAVAQYHSNYDSAPDSLHNMLEAVNENVNENEANNDNSNDNNNKIIIVDILKNLQRSFQHEEESRIDSRN